MSALVAVAERPMHRTTRSHRDSQERCRAANIQRSFLPALSVKSVPGFKFTGFYQPVDGLGGDFYDVIRFDDGCIAFYLADVSGHDFAAALVTVWLRQLLHGLRVQNPDLMHSPARVFESVQKSMELDQLDAAFLTMAYGVLDPRTGELCYATAGHPFPLLLHGDEVQSVPEANGPILSSQFGPEIGWSERKILLEIGDGLLLFSDGVVDASDWDGRTLGKAGLLNAAKEGFFVEHSAMAIGKVVQRYVGHRPAEDDVTLLLLSVSEKPRD